MSKPKTLDPNILSQFTGSEHWYRHGLVPNITFTDGAKYVVDEVGPIGLYSKGAVLWCGSLFLFRQ